MLKTQNIEQAADLIVGRAKQLVDELVEYRGHSIPPFLPQEYAHLLNISRIEKKDLGKTSALLLRFNGRYEIRVNQRDSEARQNFSCAHEIGHILFSDLGLGEYVNGIEYRRSYNPQAESRKRVKVMERLCDAAATELIMPHVVFKKYVSSFGVTVHAIERLAHIFKVSAQAAVIRMVELADKNCVALLWEPWPKTKPNGFRLAWVRGNSERGTYRPVHAYIRSPSSFDKVCRDGAYVKSSRLFMFGNTILRMPVESRGFGHKDYRYVLSLAFPRQSGNNNQMTRRSR
jgi:hypothetical protein